MSIPPCQTELSAPANLLAVKSEILGDPEDGIGHTAKLRSTEFPIEATSKYAKSDSTLRPWISPIELFVIVDIFSWEWPLILFAASSAILQRHLTQGDVDAAQPNMEPNLSFDLLMDVRWKDVGLVLGPDTHRVCVPIIAEVAHENHRSYPERNKHSHSGPQSLYKRDLHKILKNKNKKACRASYNG